MSNKKLMGSIGTLILLSIFFIRIPVLSFEFADATYYSRQDEFDLSWIHSVEKEEWVEHYVIEDNQLNLESTKFKTFGAGVPSNAEQVEIKDGFVHMKINQSYNLLNLTVSENVSSTIFLGGREFKLYEYGETYEIVVISVKKISIWQQVKGEFW